MSAVASASSIERELDVNSPLLLPLADACDARVAGGKASTLARLCALRVPVPDGVVLTTRAFEAFVSSSGLRQAIDAELSSLDDASDASALEECSRQICRRMTAAPFPLEVQAALRTAAEMTFTRRGGPSGPPTTPSGDGAVAVRSSAVGEDGHSSSFAGQFDSVLHVQTADALRDAVRTCWASYWSARAIFYRRSRRLPSAGMAVVIQQQVSAVAAGVLFTRHPDDDADDMVAEVHGGARRPARRRRGRSRPPAHFEINPPDHS